MAASTIAEVAFAAVAAVAVAKTLRSRPYSYLSQAGTACLDWADCTQLQPAVRFCCVPYPQVEVQDATQVLADLYRNGAALCLLRKAGREAGTYACICQAPASCKRRS